MLRTLTDRCEQLDGGDGGIRTLDRALQPYNGLANRRLQPLGHISGKADMPDTEASRKRQISGRQVPSGLTPEPGASSESLKLNCYLRVVDAARIGQRCLQDFLPRPRLPFPGCAFEVRLRGRSWCRAFRKCRW